MEIRVDPNKVAVAFLWVAAILIVINSVLLFLSFYLGDDSVFGLLDFFDLDIEGNVPSLYSAVAVLFCAALLALITHVNWRQSDGRRFYWLGLTILFVFLAVDEGTAIHEQIGTFLERYMEAQGAFYFLWVIPYGVVTLVLGLAYSRFVWELPKDTRFRFVTAGVIFLIGALGVEMLGAREADLHGHSTITYCVLFTVEEMLEMLGIILFIYALLRHLAAETGRISLVLER
jgi:hypothetical protein